VLRQWQNKPMFAGEQNSESVTTIGSTINNNEIISSMTGISDEESTSSQLLTYDVSSSMMQSMASGDAATTTDLMTTPPETLAIATMIATTIKPDTTTTTMKSQTTTAEPIMTTDADAITTGQEMTTSKETSTILTTKQTSSGLTTVAYTSVSSSLRSSPPDDIHCCCRCCFPSTNACKVCEGDTLTDASKCANEKPKTIRQVDRNTPKFEAPSTLKGSQHPERFALREDFLKMEQLTENLASLSESQRIDLGFKSNDLIVDCIYNGKPCTVEQLVYKCLLLFLLLISINIIIH